MGRVSSFVIEVSGSEGQRSFDPRKGRLRLNSFFTNAEGRWHNPLSGLVRARDRSGIKTLWEPKRGAFWFAEFARAQTPAPGMGAFLLERIARSGRRPEAPKINLTFGLNVFFKGTFWGKDVILYEGGV
jgi:hypothetical protein